jgi:hypothetical protein
MGDSIHSACAHPSSASAASTLEYGRKLRRFVAHDSAFPHQFPAHFELRLHQHHNLRALCRDRAAEKAARITAAAPASRK